MKNVSWIICILLLVSLQICVLSNKHKLGGIFEHIDRRKSNMFQLAGTIAGVDIVTETVNKMDFLSASHAVCKLKREGVAGIFVPPTGSTSEYVASECQALDVPFIRDLVNVYIQPQILNELYVGLVRTLQWKTFTFLYEDNLGLLRLSQLLKTFSPVTVRQLDAKHNYRTMLQEMRESGERNIFLDCVTGALPEILSQAQQAGLITPHHSYIVTSMDLNTIDLKPYKYAGANIIGLNAINPVNDVLQIIKMDSENVNVSSAFVYDTVSVYSHVLQQLDLNFTSRECEPESKPKYISSIKNYISKNSVSVHGMTGSVQLDKSGNRTNMMLDVLRLEGDGLTTVGTWNSSDTLRLRFQPQPRRFVSKKLPGNHLIVLTIISTPYVMRKHSDHPLEGNDQYEGYVVDILEEISEILGFTYEFKLNYEYGSLDPQTNRWTGMLHELQARRADMVVADLTITTERYADFDFTMPFINTGISILYYKSSPHFGISVLSIFNYKLWLCLAFCLIFMGFMFFILARLSPFQRINGKDHTKFTFSNSLWFVVASMRPLGCGIEPRSLSTRFLAMVWWHFVTFIMATYVAGLIALTYSDGSADSPIKNVRDLVENEDIKFGAVRHGSTLKFFRESSEPMFQQMYTEMVSFPDVLVPNIEAGVERVKTEKGGYAFLTDALSIEYAVMCDPDLVQIGDLLDYRGYGIALPRGSPYRKSVNAALLKMKESGRLLALKVRWWHRPCQKNNLKRHAVSFQFNNLAMAFLLLVIVCIVAIVIAVFEQKHKKTVKIVDKSAARSNSQSGGDMNGRNMVILRPLGNAPNISITGPSPEVISRREHP